MCFKILLVCIFGGASVFAFYYAGADLGAVLAGLAIVIWFMKLPRRFAPPVPIAQARIPSYHIVCASKKFEGEVCVLELDTTMVRVLRGDGTLLTSFAREWADVAMRLPGFIYGDQLVMADASWSPPDDAQRGFWHDLMTDLQVLNGGNPWETWIRFACDANLKRALKAYRRATPNALGSQVAPRYHAVARRQIRMGVTSLVGGGLLVLAVLPMFLLDIQQLEREDRDGLAQLGTVGGFVAFLGSIRLLRGMRSRKQAVAAEKIAVPNDAGRTAAMLVKDSQ